jgi:Sec-independent protein translocase protein TatA
MNFFGIGGLELIVIFGLAFFVLGPKKMIETSRSAGKLIRELKAERDKFTKMVMTEFDTEDEKPARSPDNFGSSASSGSSGGGNDAPAPVAPSSPDEAPAGAVSRPRGRAGNMADFGYPGGPVESDGTDASDGDVAPDADTSDSPDSQNSQNSGERESA